MHGGHARVHACVVPVVSAADSWLNPPLASIFKKKVVDTGGLWAGGVGVDLLTWVSCHG